jgi:FKBP-type peptidyl-prolyl cis-trans isomerase 2
MTIKKGDKIKVDYTGTLDDGTVFDTSEGKQPIEFEVGKGMVIPGFDNAVVGMKKGEEKDVKLQAKDAYGERNDQLLKKVPKEQLPQGPEPKVGMMVGLSTPQGQQIPAKITEVTDKEITIDLNHPLAGKALNFKIKVVEVS